MKIGVLKNFAKLTGKHLCQSLFFNKVTDLRPATLLKRVPGTVVFLRTYRTFKKPILKRRKTASDHVVIKY